MSRSIADEIKDRLDIVDIIGQTVTLTKESNGEYAGATSATSQSGASLKVNPKLQCWHNFADGASGDVFDWIGYINNFSNVRGNDFPEVLRIAASMAGVELEEVTEESKTQAKEKAEIQEILTLATEIYHKKLTERPELYDCIFDKWGINEETVDSLKIGYAESYLAGNGEWSAKINLKELHKLKPSRAGLQYAGKYDGAEIFHGRLIFPYWKNGKVVYMIGRATDETPLKKDGEKPPKYKKLLVFNEKNEYVSKTLQNCYFYGEDSLRGADYCIITEGVTDCISMLQAGFPCISPVTVAFRDEDINKVISLTKRLSRVYICNDNELNNSGEKGALKTAGALEKAGVKAKIITLPKPDAVDKIDIAEYMKDHTAMDFEELMKGAKSYYEHLISKLQKSENASENIETVKKFIQDWLMDFPSDVIDSLVNHEIKSHFKFNREDCRNIMKFFKRTKREMTENQQSESGDYRPPFDEVAQRTIDAQKIITFDDTGEFYIYENGVYVNKGAETKIKILAISKFHELCAEHDVELTSPNIDYMSNVLEYIKIYTHVYRDEVDNNPRHKFTINMKNGLFNINTMELEPHTPDYITVRQIPINYDKNAQCPHFLKFLSEVVTPADAEVLLEYIGYTLVPDTRQEQNVMLHGSGANGKSKLIEFIIALHGTDNVCTTSLQRLCEDRFAMAELYGKLLNVFPDMSDRMIKDDESFKGLTSGDLLTAQKKYFPAFQFRNIARQMYSVNKVPPVSDASYAYFRRWILVDFPYTFTDNPKKENNLEKKKDKDLSSKLVTPEELSGAFNVVIDCLKHVYEQGKFSNATTVEKVAENYLMRSDPIRIFVELYTESSDSDIPKKELYDCFERWCKFKNIELVTYTRFCKRMKSMGVEEYRPRNDYGEQLKCFAEISTNGLFDNEIPTKDEIKSRQKTLSEVTVNSHTKKPKKQYWEKFISSNPVEI